MGKRCDKGKSCGATCIERLDVCRLDLSQSQDMTKAKKAISEPPLISKGKDVDVDEVDKKAKDWREKAGLRSSPETIEWKHDRVHVLLHDLMGGDDMIGKWVGDGPKSPSPAEELLVGMVQRAAAMKGRGQDTGALTDSILASIFEREIRFIAGLAIPPENKKNYFNSSGMPEVDKFVKKYREMERQPGFDKLLDAIQTAWPDIGNYT